MAQKKIEEIARLLTTDRGSNSKPILLNELENGCIVCISHKLNTKGYLRLGRNGQLVLAHRLVYEYFHGPIPDGFLVCHSCDNPPCLNPEHFFAGTNADNLRDMVEKGRAAKGEKHSQAKLTDEKVLDIRLKYRTGEYTYNELRQEYGIGLTQISNIVNGKQWSHLENNASEASVRFLKGRQ